MMIYRIKIYRNWFWDIIRFPNLVFDRAIQKMYLVFDYPCEQRKMTLQIDPSNFGEITKYKIFVVLGKYSNETLLSNIVFLVLFCLVILIWYWKHCHAKNSWYYDFYEVPVKNLTKNEMIWSAEVSIIGKIMWSIAIKALHLFCKKYHFPFKLEIS